MLKLTCLLFNQLTVHELYALMRLRQEVFIVEQNCPYLDADGLDQSAWHLFGWDAAGRLVAYTRLLPLNVPFHGCASIGRVVTAPFARGTGAGREIMQRSIEFCWHLFGAHPIKIGAQSYLLNFYASLGFESTGENYLEDGIPHTKMVLPFE